MQEPDSLREIADHLLIGVAIVVLYTPLSLAYWIAYQTTRCIAATIDKM